VGLFCFVLFCFVLSRPTVGSAQPACDETAEIEPHFVQQVPKP
jgi:hypothetical protein